MTIDSASFYQQLVSNNINYFVGVPDSLLKNFCLSLDEHADSCNHVIAANEGNAIAIAAGHYLGTNNVPLVYMQNSGIGNAVNPLLSLCDSGVYGIPMLLLIGWRGEPGKNDAVQHSKSGSITKELLRVLDIPFEVLDPKSDFVTLLNNTLRVMKERSQPVALLVTDDAFSKHPPRMRAVNPEWANREESIELVVSTLCGAEYIFVATTGESSRELYDIRQARGESHSSDFLNVGAMGHASSIAVGLALSNSNKRITCIDGDGSLIMHMGSLAIIGSKQASNFLHIVINNGAHDSVGGQPTAGFDIDICKIALACGYTHAFSTSNPREIVPTLHKIKDLSGPILVEIFCNCGSRKNLSRPGDDLRSAGLMLMRNIQSCSPRRI